MGALSPICKGGKKFRGNDLVIHSSIGFHVPRSLSVIHSFNQKRVLRSAGMMTSMSVYLFFICVSLIALK